jgi:subfamily B ATP-binding cassette protein MsbA
MEKYSRAYNTMQEKFAGIYTIFSFGREKFEAMRCTRSLRESTQVQVKFEISNSLAQMTSMFIGSLGPLAVLFYGGQEIMRGNMTIGEFYAFNAYLGYLFGPAHAITNLNFEIQSSLAALGRIFELFDSRPEIAESARPVPVPAELREIEYSGVSFRYGAKADLVLREIDFRIRTGEFFALVGLSGAGKSTLVNLLPRFFDPVEGKILINGVDIREMSVRGLRKMIGIVPQDVFLFEGTIGENIAYGDRWAGREEIVSAAKSANADAFIRKLPLGYETEVGERGVKLSGGEKQRVAIARAALKSPKILILDEATAALDSESEVLIQDALRRLTKDKATIVIAHRLTTILNATEILVLHNGEIIETGSHTELYEQGGFYRKLYDTQFRKRAVVSEEDFAGN